MIEKIVVFISYPLALLIAAFATFFLISYVEILKKLLAPLLACFVVTLIVSGTNTPLILLPIFWAVIFVVWVIFTRPRGR